ncbi:sphingomyelin phosphodiesterase 4 [Neocloeon triangulifer]|uniref:sphingomyelin phosphodiesterase 4 n=1 Tax=Neocloeon triangulifer TaxID=2078957 RepID=UPI00286F4C29|nr:sphingomyelin phosphodiesterase 4 [Neocloeon triangulifer]
MRNDAITFRVQQVLSQPLVLRCQELTALVAEVDSKQLKDTFPLILENIFGSPGWGLRLSDRSVLSLQRDAVCKFLDPTGPLFVLAYKLCADFFLKYDLPLNLLPAKLRRDLEKGMLMNSWYCERIFVDPNTRRATMLKLSAFELLVFRFALHLLPQTQPEVWLESVYLQLLERYLCHFLPCQMQPGPVEPHVPYVPHQPLSSAPFAHHSPLSSQTQGISLLKVAGAQNSSMHHHGQHNPLAEIWRTVHIVNILMDIWLSFDDEKGNISPSNVKTSPVSSLPSSEHARMARALLKHLHYFANSACYTNPSDMDEMKRMVIPMYKQKIYHFLSGCIKSWPYDQSFRIILEAWLSYIQPWRYTNYANYGMRENDESGKAVDRRWQSFVAENLPFYGCIFQQVMHRLSRIDLSILKNAIMLHRVCRLLCLENMKAMVSEVEESLRLKGSVQQATLMSSRFLDSSADASMAVSLKSQAAAQAAISELEGQLFVYKPMFGQEVNILVWQLLRALMLSRQKAEGLYEEQKMRPRSNGFWNAILCFDDDHAEEYTVDDRRRVVDILKNCYTQLCTVYEINYIEDDSDSERMNRTFLSSSDSSFRDRMLDSSSLSPSKPMVPKPSGDPDKRPICSFEVAWLVRMFHDISSYLNREHHFEIQALHTREDMWGRLARQVLQPPTTISVYERGPEGYKVRTEKTLPARVSLRRLANTRLLFWLGVACLLAKICGFHFFLGLALPFLLFSGYIFVNALRE